MHGLSGTLMLALLLELPNASRKTNLMIGNDFDGGNFGDSVEDQDDDPFVSFQFFGKQSRQGYAVQETQNGGYRRLPLVRSAQA